MIYSLHPTIQKHIDKLNWDMISANPHATHLILKNLDKVVFPVPLYANKRLYLLKPSKSSLILNSLNEPNL
jgi:hypothetical protein